MAGYTSSTCIMQAHPQHNKTTQQLPQNKQFAFKTKASSLVTMTHQSVMLRILRRTDWPHQSNHQILQQIHSPTFAPGWWGAPISVMSAHSNIEPPDGIHFVLQMRQFMLLETACYRVNDHHQLGERASACLYIFLRVALRTSANTTNPLFEDRFDECTSFVNRWSRREDIRATGWGLTILMLRSICSALSLLLCFCTLHQKKFIQ